MRARLATAALLALLLVVAGCGGAGDGAAGALRTTSDNIGKLRSGRLDVRFVMHPRGAAGDVGVELVGPFSIPDKRGQLPRLDVRYTRLAGTRRTTARLVSTGAAAWVVSGGKARRLSPAQAKPLADAAGPGLGALGIDPAHWIDHARMTAGPTLDGGRTDRITGGLEVSAAAKDLSRLAGRAVGGADARRLDDATRSSSIEVLTGHDDRLLRRMSVSIRLDLPPALRARAGGSAGLDVTLLVSIRRPNRPIAVRAPAG